MEKGSKGVVVGVSGVERPKMAPELCEGWWRGSVTHERGERAACAVRTEVPTTRYLPFWVSTP